MGDQVLGNILPSSKSREIVESERIGDYCWMMGWEGEREVSNQLLRVFLLGCELFNRTPPFLLLEAADQRTNPRQFAFVLVLAFSLSHIGAARPK